MQTAGGGVGTSGTKVSAIASGRVPGGTPVLVVGEQGAEIAAARRPARISPRRLRLSAGRVTELVEQLHQAAVPLPRMPLPKPRAAPGRARPPARPSPAASLSARSASIRQRHRGFVLGHTAKKRSSTNRAPRSSIAASLPMISSSAMRSTSELWAAAIRTTYPSRCPPASRFAPARVVGEDLAHGRGRHRQEVGAIVPARRIDRGELEERLWTSAVAAACARGLAAEVGSRRARSLV